MPAPPRGHAEDTLLERLGNASCGCWARWPANGAPATYGQLRPNALATHTCSFRACGTPRRSFARPGHTWRTLWTRLVLRMGAWSAHVRLGQLLSVRPTGELSDTGSHAGGVPRWCPQPCQERAQSVPGGGETGGLQISAPQVRPSDRSGRSSSASRGMAADSSGHSLDTPGAGPTAHRTYLVLRVLLDCCAARPNWTVL